MANKDRPSGFKPKKGDKAQISYHSLSDTNAEIKRFHPVVKAGTGYVAEATAGAGANSILGIAAEYKAANSGGNLAVFDDPNEVFLAQDDGVGTATSVASEGSNMDFVNTHTSTNNGLESGAELDGSTANTTSTLQFKILRKHDIPSNDYGANCIWECMINSEVHQLGSPTGI